MSKTLGPSGVNATVSTVRGDVVSNWSRHLPASNDPTCDGGCVLQLRVTVPVSMHATISIPLLTKTTAGVVVFEQSRALWSGDQALPGAGAVGALALAPWAHNLAANAQVRRGSEGSTRLELAAPAGTYRFTVHHAELASTVRANT